MKYYLTTPIYYTNGTPHIGHTYSTMAADLIRRFKRMQGYEAFLTTGADEHGVNVERSAKNAGKTPQQFTDVIAAEFRKLWEDLGLDVDYFIRTSDPRHHETVRWLFERCLKNGYVYEGEYSGQYCVFDNLYVNDAKPGDPCPDCGRPTETVTEENYFFKLSAFQDRLLKLYEDHPEFVQPETRRNEVISFVKQGLRDLSITRTSIQWGIPAPVPGKHVFYVWFDALIAYLSAVRHTELWPADLHLVGKEIVRFHAVFWPAFLMAADLPLPKRIYAHGWLLFEQDKMSKSRGNVVRPQPIAQVVGVDGLRYFLMREIVFGQDGSFSYDALIGRYNSELANGLGNLASRTLTMIQQYNGGAIPASDGDARITSIAEETIKATITLFEEFEFSKGLEAIWRLLTAVDQFIVKQAPWKLAKDPAAREALGLTLYTAAEALRIVTVLLAPVMPQSTEKIWSQLGIPEPVESVRLDALTWGQLKAGQQIGEIAAVFPRIEMKDAVEKMRALEAEVSAQQTALLGKKPEAPAPNAQDPAPAFITIDDFAKVDLRVGVVLSAEPVKGADKLLHLKVDIGEPEPRTIVAGIAEAYRPDQMQGRKVVIVANLQPRKLRGITSQGMIVAASIDGGKPALAGFLEDVPGRSAAEVTFVDTHCHLDDKQFAGDREAVIERAQATGVARMMAIGTGDGPADLETAIRLADCYPFFYATVGVHPHDASKATPETFDRLRDLLAAPKVLALGEIGLDYHYDFSPRDVQHSVFIRQLALARDAGKPIVIHTREAWNDTLQILREHYTGGGIFHCFTGGPAEAQEALDTGFHLSFGGVLTFPKAQNVRDAARLTPLDRLLVETDAPYLAPVPHRGKRNEPAFLVETARKLAEIRGISPEELGAATTRNFEHLCLRYTG